jgi:hypothetical protein
VVAAAWLAWHSMQRSMMWLRQMAQLSTTMSARGWDVSTSRTGRIMQRSHPMPTARRRSTALCVRVCVCERVRA